MHELKDLIAKIVSDEENAREETISFLHENKLTKLDLSDCNFGGYAPGILKTIISCLENLSTVEEIDLHANYFGDRGILGVEAVGDILIRFNVLHTLNLSFNFNYHKYTPGSFNCLGACLEKLPALTTLNFVGNSIGSNGKESVDEFGYLLSKCPQLTELNVAFNNMESYALDIAGFIVVGCPQLRKLNISENRIESKGFEVLSILQDCDQLEEINFRHNKMRSVERQSNWFACFMSAIHNENDQSSDVCDELSLLANSTQKYKKLSSLFLDGNGIGKGEIEQAIEKRQQIRRKIRSNASALALSFFHPRRPNVGISSLPVDCKRLIAHKFSEDAVSVLEGNMHALPPELTITANPVHDKPR